MDVVDRTDVVDGTDAVDGTDVADVVAGIFSVWWSCWSGWLLVVLGTGKIEAQLRLDVQEGSLPFFPALLPITLCNSANHLKLTKISWSSRSLSLSTPMPLARSLSTASLYLFFSALTFSLQLLKNAGVALSFQPSCDRSVRNDVPNNS